MSNKSDYLNKSGDFSATQQLEAAYGKFNIVEGKITCNILSLNRKVFRIAVVYNNKITHSEMFMRQYFCCLVYCDLRAVLKHSHVSALVYILNILTIRPKMYRSNFNCIEYLIISTPF